MQIAPGHIAVVTGAASGIGLALTRALAQRGVTVVMTDIESDALTKAAASIESATAPTAVVCDVSDAESVAALRRQVIDEFGHVDFLFNNAGVILPFKPTWEHSLDDWDWIFGVNFRGVVHGIREFAPLMVEQGSGHIINTASMAAVSVIPFNSAYNATKHATISLSETLAAELAQKAPGVHASVVCPGLVPTRISDAERNRPGAAPKPQADADEFPPEIDEHSRDNGVPADVVADRILRGVEADQVYIFTNPGSEVPTEARFEGVHRDLATSNAIIASGTS